MEIIGVFIQKRWIRRIENQNFPTR